MATYAKIENGIVTNMIIAEKEFIDSGVLEGLYLECTPRAYNNKVTDEDGKIIPDQIPLRFNYPDIGSVYNSEHDAFYAPYPDDGTTWIINENFIWVRPIPKPVDEINSYSWNEELQNWEIVNNTIPVSII